MTLPTPPTRVRKEIKIRPGFTPQEDVKRFRGTKQAQMDAHALPKGHVIGWAPPPSSSSATASASAEKKSTAGMSKSAKKNEKRKEKRKEKAAEKVKDSWEDEDEEEPSAAAASGEKKGSPPEKDAKAAGEDGEADALTDKLKKLDVQ